jgi:hypothetical protein
MVLDITANVLHEDGTLTNEFDRLVVSNPARVGIWINEVFDRAETLCKDESCPPALDLTITRRK